LNQGEIPELAPGIIPDCFCSGTAATMRTSRSAADQYAARTLYIHFAPSAYNQVELSTLVNGGMHEWLRATGLH
jgi:hypothetical protein